MIAPGGSFDSSLTVWRRVEVARRRLKIWCGQITEKGGYPVDSIQLQEYVFATTAVTCSFSYTCHSGKIKCNHTKLKIRFINRGPDKQQNFILHTTLSSCILERYPNKSRLLAGCYLCLLSCCSRNDENKRFFWITTYNNSAELRKLQPRNVTLLLYNSALSTLRDFATGKGFYWLPRRFLLNVTKAYSLKEGTSGRLRIFPKLGEYLRQDDRLCECHMRIVFWQQRRECDVSQGC